MSRLVVVVVAVVAAGSTAADAAIKNPIHAGNKFATLGGAKITPPH